MTMGTTKDKVKAFANGTLPERYEYALVCIDGSASFAEGVLRYFVERQRSGESSQPIDFALRALDHHQALRTAAEEYALVYHDDPQHGHSCPPADVADQAILFPVHAVLCSGRVGIDDEIP